MSKTFKRLVIGGLLSILMALGGCLYFLAPHPPREAELIQNFQDHRAGFEKLRDMLEADTQLRRVATWGLEMDHPFYLGPASGGKFPADRYKQYLTQLKEVNAVAADRAEGNPAVPDILLWGWGWAGDTQHIGLCWLENPPTNLVPSIDNYRRTVNDIDHWHAYKHIDQNWYLWTDR